MTDFFKEFIEESKKIKAKIVYDEIQDERIVKAVLELKQEWFEPVVVWTRQNLETSFWEKLNEIEHFECSQEDDPTFFAWQLLADSKVDWFISWAVNTTGQTLKALFKTVWVQSWIKRMSWYFLMQTSRWLMIFADCAVQPNPTSEQLAEIAYLSILSARTFGIKPKVAMLSFSTLWSAVCEQTQKVIDATAILRQKLSDENITDVELAWELQLDAAVDPLVASKKVKDGSWAWGANVLIFPDLNAWNIWYKLVQYFGWAQAIGPILQWVAKPWNDLSRGCSVDDIKVLHSITVLQTKK